MEGIQPRQPSVAGPLLVFIIPNLVFVAWLLSGVDIPGAIGVRSAGTFYPSLRDGPVVLGTAIAVATLIAYLLSLRFSKVRADPPRAAAQPSASMVRSIAEPAALAAIAYALAYGFADPPYLVPSNFRFLWVDPLLHENHRIAIFYFIPTLFKSHFISAFGAEATPHFVAICVALTALVFWDCCRLLGLGSPWRMAATASFIASGHLLVFYQPAEDVTFVNLAGLVALNAFLRRNAVFSGVAIAVLLLTRPTLFMLPVSLMLADIASVLAAGRAGPLHRRLIEATFANFYVVVTTAIAISLTGALNLYWFLNGIHNLQQFDPVFTPIAIDGFLISSWSGVYLFHYLWTFNPVVNGAMLATLFVRGAIFRAGLFASLFVFTYFLAVEYRGSEIIYYNFRFAIYVYPYVMLAAWAAVSLVGTLPARVVLGSGLAVAIVFGAHFNIISDFGSLPRLARIHGIYEDRNEVRRITAGRAVVIDQSSCKIAAYNMITGVLLRDAPLTDLSAGVPEAGTLVVYCGREAVPEGAQVILNSGGTMFVEAGGR